MCVCVCVYVFMMVYALVDLYHVNKSDVITGSCTATDKPINGWLI